jgi:5-methylcytosine-specific restriction endonuclease McrA
METSLLPTVAANPKSSTSLSNPEKVLVLNQDYQAISVCSAERAFILVHLRKAELIHSAEGRVLRSISREYSCPNIIRLNRYIRLPYRKVSLTRTNIFRRDNNQCVYCGSKHNLTIDHVRPRSMGGKDDWENLVTACQNCNMHKGNALPEEKGMVMRHKPFRPSFIMFLGSFTTNINDAWRPYLMI